MCSLLTEQRKLSIVHQRDYPTFLHFSNVSRRLFPLKLHWLTIFTTAIMIVGKVVPNTQREYREVYNTNRKKNL